MVDVLSRCSQLVYKKAIKPALFKKPPDYVHETMIQYAQHRGLLRLSKIMHFMWAYDNPAVLAQKIGSVSFANPIGLSAGLDKNAQLPPICQRIGFGVSTVGSISAEPCAGNPKPWFYRLPKSQALVVNAGLPNDGAARVGAQLDKLSLGITATFPIVASIARTNSARACSEEAAILDYCISAKRLNAVAGVRALEINISCPNTYGGEPFTTPEKLSRLLAALRATHSTKPLWIKMPINLPWHEFQPLLEVACRYNVQAVTIGNLNKNRGEIPSGELPSQVKGNLSGRPTQALSNALIAKTYLHYNDRLTIIGVGGVFNAHDAYQKIRLGASLVELITGLIYEGPQLIGQINRDLVSLLQKDGLSSIGEAIGLDAQAAAQ